MKNKIFWAIDGSVELYRCFYSNFSYIDSNGSECGGSRVMLRSMWNLLRTSLRVNDREPHFVLTFDETVNSFRNDLWEGYKNERSAVVPDGIREQRSNVRLIAEALGVTYLAHPEYEADDILSSLAFKFKDQADVIIWVRDKDLVQCLYKDDVVIYDPVDKRYITQHMAEDKYGVEINSFVDYQALVGEPLDGFPGLVGWGAKTASRLLSFYKKIENIPRDARDWVEKPRSYKRASNILNLNMDKALLFRELATLRTDYDLDEISKYSWNGFDLNKLSNLCDLLGTWKIKEEIEEFDSRYLNCDYAI